MEKIEPWFFGVASRFCEKFNIESKLLLYMLRFTFFIIIMSYPASLSIYVLLYLLIEEGEKETIKENEMGE
jgi:hypothetical protein